MSFDVKLPDEDTSMRGRGLPDHVREMIDQRLRQQQGILRRNEIAERKHAREEIESKHHIYLPDSYLDNFAPIGFQSVNTARSKSGIELPEHSRSRHNIEITNVPRGRGNLLIDFIGRYDFTNEFRGFSAFGQSRGRGRGRR